MRQWVLSVPYPLRFLFAPDRARQPVKALSGRERNRLLLAKLFTRPSNALVLDEPTNDLDADTLELLEALLVAYPGTVLLVSHDRAFLSNVVTSTLVFEGGGTVREYVGGYNDWLRQRPSAAPARPAVRPSDDRPREPCERAGRLSYREQRELEALPGMIEDLEAERDALHAAMSGLASYQQERAAVAAVETRLAEIGASLEAAYARWELLESRVNEAVAERR